MKKVSLIVLALIILVFLFASISAVSAQPNAPIACVLDITYDDYIGPGEGYWLGTVTGCSIEGTIRFDAVPEEYFDAGKTTHFVEEFTIEPYSGGVIKGKNWGVWNFSTFKFRANGWVTDASAEWAHLVGFKYHEMGTTSNPADGLPLTAPDGTMRLVPANR